MKKNITLLSITVFAPVFFLYLIFQVVINFMPEYKKQREFTKLFKQIDIGDKKNGVIAILGEPDNESTSFRLGQYQGFEKAYERAKESDSKCYLLWYRGVDHVYTIGFNNEDIVTIAEYGGT